MPGGKPQGRNTKKHIVKELNHAKVLFYLWHRPAQPFRGGWTEITAPDRSCACTIFKMFHPNREGSAGQINCADIYSESEFMESAMLLNGNFGAWCQEEIILSRELIARESTKHED